MGGKTLSNHRADGDPAYLQCLQLVSCTALHRARGGKWAILVKSMASAGIMGAPGDGVLRWVSLSARCSTSTDPVLDPGLGAGVSAPAAGPVTEIDAEGGGSSRQTATPPTGSSRTRAAPGEPPLALRTTPETSSGASRPSPSSPAFPWCSHRKDCAAAGAELHGFQAGCGRHSRYRGGDNRATFPPQREGYPGPVASAEPASSRRAPARR